MRTEELTAVINGKIRKLKNSVEVISCGGCLSLLKKTLQKLEQEIVETIAFINEISKGE